MNHRKNKKNLQEDIVDPGVHQIAKEIAKMKEKQKAHAIIDSVINTLDRKDIKLSGSEKPIDFTD